MITEATASGSEVDAVVQKLEPLLFNEKRTTVIIALLSMVITLMEPRCTTEQLEDAVKNVSQYICLLFAGADEPALTAEQLN